MNKRIKELAEQAKEYADTKYSKLVSASRWGDCVPSIRELYSKKFAELIVRECASQVRFTDLLLCNDDSDGEILLQASVQLKQHFGVEE